ncbi:MAG: hypothetical protein BWK79_03950 [Beggiatoa sp. IS2]|nr:MAG: hypothetical protein BWK79_03950 [Beggiatoa sp. IS2]
MTARQWVAHAGLDPREYTSGSRVNKKPRLSKVGNRYLRCALFMPALLVLSLSKQARFGIIFTSKRILTI